MISIATFTTHDRHRLTNRYQNTHRIRRYINACPTVTPRCNCIAAFHHRRSRLLRIDNMEMRTRARTMNDLNANQTSSPYDGMSVQIKFNLTQVIGKLHSLGDIIRHRQPHTATNQFRRPDF